MSTSGEEEPTDNGPEGAEHPKSGPPSGAPAADFGFDFGAFEASEAEAALTAARTDEVSAPIEKPPEKRSVVARNWLAPGDAVVDVRPVGNMTVVSLRGRINETFRGTELGQSLQGVVVFDLSQVDRISSFGVKGWLQMLDNARLTTCYFFRCSEAVVNQITMMRNFCGPGRIHSLLVPYACTACGEEFSAVYEAVSDRELLLGRSPVTVECPRCSAGAGMADDPWAYFALDDHLLEDVPADLEQVVEHLTQGHRVDPIEKFVSEDETRIRLNHAIDGKLRLGRALAGLEGRVVFDLTPRPTVEPAGIQRLLEAIRELEPEVTEVWIDGAPKQLVEAILANPPDRTYVSTAWVTATSNDTSVKRPVLIDLRKRRQMLLRGEVPPIEAGWAKGPLQFEDVETVFAAARHLMPPDRTATPAPVASHPAAAPMMIEAPPARGVPFWQVAAIATLVAVVATTSFAAVFGLVYANMGSGGGGQPALSATELGGEVPAPITAPVAEGWDNGSPLPPAWVEQPLVVTADAVRAVGLGRGETAEFASERSRLLALYRFSQHVGQRLEKTQVAEVVGEAPGEDAAERVAEEWMTAVGSFATPQRVNHAVKREPGGYTVATQHELATDAIEQVVGYYGEVYDFRGLTVARRFLNSEANSDLVVAKAQSWFKGVHAGDSVLQVGRERVTDLETFKRVAPQAWRDTAEGGTLTVWVEHEGERLRIDFDKAVQQRRERPFDLLPLELGK